MTMSNKHLTVGSPDSESRTSPILEETDEDYDVIAQEVEDLPNCYFNNVAYSNGTYVCSSSALLRCEKGIWVRNGGCDPDNP